MKDEIIEHLMDLRMAKNNYDLQKYQWEMERLKLKYSTEYMKYKTIKEKEEHAKLETEHMGESVLHAKAELRMAEMMVQIDELNMLYSDVCDCDGNCNCEHKEPNLIDAETLLVDHNT